MDRIEEADLISVLNRLEYRAPALDAVWRPDQSQRKSGFRLGLLVPIAVIAILTAATGVVANANGWFEQFVPSGACIPNDPSCGADFAQVAIAIDQTTDVTLVNILVESGLSRERLAEIAQSVANEQDARRTIVYILDDLPPGPMSAGFAGSPADDTAAPLSPPAELTPYLRLTYDSGPAGAHEIWP